MLDIDLEASRQAMEEENTGQWQQKGTAVWYCSCGLHTPLVLNAVETAVPGGNARGRAENVSEMTI